MVSTQNTSITPNGDSDCVKLLKDAINRASETKESGNSDPMGFYPVLWMYAVTREKSWEQVRTDAENHFKHSATTSEIDRFLAIADTLQYRTVLESFSMHLWCKWNGYRSPRRHKWTSLELSIACPENDEAIRAADFREKLEDEIAYLDFEIQ